MFLRNWLVGILVVLVSLAIAGCGSEGSYSLHINFPNEYAKQSISGLTLWAVGAGDADCEQVMLGEVEPDNLNIRAKTSIPYPAGEEPVFDQVPSGKLLFIVDGLNQAGIVLLRGCEPVRVEGGATVDVTVTLEWVCEPDPQGEVADNQKDDDCDGKVDEEECLTDVECDDNNTCTADTCADQECLRVPLENGWACDDGTYCTIDDACMNGVCLGVLNDCDDDDTCTQDSCNQDLERCDHVMRLIPDAEGPPGNSTCSNGSDDDCDGLTDGEDPSCKTCTQDDECDDGLPCTQDACAGGDCENIPIADGTACDDADSCTTGEACLSGVCVGTGYSCEDGNVCTNDICNGDGTCSHDNNTFPCDDNDPCTRDDVCSQGACSGTAYSCDDDNVCTDDSCSGDGTCNHINNSAPCDDADACTMSDTCAGGSCSGVPLDADGDRYVDENCGGDDCDDNDAGVSPGVFETDPACGDGIDNDCDGLTDTADPGCQNCTQDGDCGDDNVCNGLESCQGGICSAGTALFCDDDNNCTDDSCDPIDGCRHVDNAVSCDDGDPCTSGDACSGGECAGTPYSCNDDNQCTDDTCDGDGTCSIVNNADPCDDGDPCTRDDTCSDGSCMGMRYNCDDDNPCTDDSCNGDGTCSNPNNTNPCDDGDDCTMDDACSGGVCAGAPMDADHDGYVAESCGGDDCDDGSAAANPGVFEGPLNDPKCVDGRDNDCDGLFDNNDFDCSGFHHRRMITIDHNQVGSSCSTDLENFPVLICLTANWLKTTAVDPVNGRIENEDGSDIIFLAADGITQLDHEKELYDGTNGKLVAWVRAPILFHDTYTDIYIYYGSEIITEDSGNPTGVWDSDFEAVWHMAKDYALSFDGTDDYLSVSDPGTESVLDFENGDSITISSWIYPNSLVDWGVIITKGDNPRDVAEPNYVFQGASHADPQKLSFKYSDGSGYHIYETDSGMITAGKWYHAVVAYTFGTGSTATIYVDGVERAGRWTAGDGNTVPIVSDQPLWIGANDRDPGVPGELDLWDGIIDEVRIWRRALNSTEVEDLHLGRPVSTAGLVGEWLMNEGAGNTISDSSGEGNDGDMTGHAASWIPIARDSTSHNYHGLTHNMDSTNQVDARIGGGFVFDGIGEYFSHSAIDISSATGGTMEFWFKTSDIAAAPTLAGDSNEWNDFIRISQWSNAFSMEDHDGNSLGFGTIIPPYLVDDTWYYLVITLDESLWQGEINLEATSEKPAYLTFYRQERIGKGYSDQDFIGVIDEVRISNVARDHCWTQTCFNNQESPATFYSVGNEIR